MRFIKNVLFAVVILIVVFLAGAYVLPSRVDVSRDIVVSAPISKIFPHVNDLRKFQVWSPWAVIDSDMKVVYSGTTKGKGQVMSWTSKDPNVGSGVQEITDSVVDKRVTTKLDFGEQGFATASWDLTDEGSGTKIVWSFQTDLGSNPMMRWMGLLFDGWIGKDYEKGLKSLKTIVENER